MLRQPVETLANLRFQTAGYRLQVVTGLALEKGAYCDGRVVPCQFRSAENRGCCHAAWGRQHDVPRRWQIDRLQGFADSLGPGVTPEYEDRHVSTEWQRQLK